MAAMRIAQALVVQEGASISAAVARDLAVAPSCQGAAAAALLSVLGIRA